MKMETAYATTWTTAWVCWTIAGSATALVRSTTADVIPFLRAIAIAMATSSTKLACVGECTLDLDMDGICDDIDTCLGNLDECGICNGPGAVYQCGCDFLPLGDCDCEGNQVDALGVCGGDCEADANCNGVMTRRSWMHGHDGVQFPSHGHSGRRQLHVLHLRRRCVVRYTLTVEAHPAVNEGLTRYRLYVNMVNVDDRLSAVFGNTMNNLVVDAPMGAYNHSVNGSWNASGLNPFFIYFYPELADDTYGTIGLTEPEHTSDIPDAMDPVLAEDPSQPISPFFQTNGATGLEATSFIGSAWYVLNTAGNGLPDGNGRVIVMQVTTSGDIMGQINTQIFPMSSGDDNQIASFIFEEQARLVQLAVPGTWLADARTRRRRTGSFGRI